MSHRLLSPRLVSVHRTRGGQTLNRSAHRLVNWSRVRKAEGVERRKDFSHYRRVILKWWWFLALCMLSAAGTTYMLCQRITPTYEATTTLIVGQSLQTANVSPNDVLAGMQLAKTYAELVRGPSVLEATINSLGLPTTWQALQASTSVELVRDTQLMRVSARDSSPELARRVADEIARQLILKGPTYELSPELDLGFPHDTIDADAASAGVDALKSTGPVASYLSVVEPARLPAIPVSPQPGRDVPLAAAAGLAVASGLVLLIEHLDDRIRSPDQISSQLALVALGAVAALKDRKYPARLITNGKPPNGVVEAYRMIRNNIEFASGGAQMRTLLVTSPGPMEGKSVTAANLAVVMAQSGTRVILIDANLGRPIQHRIFELSNGVGLSSALLRPDWPPPRSFVKPAWGDYA